MVFIDKPKQSKPQYLWVLLVIFIIFDCLLVLLTLRIDRKDCQGGSMGVPVERHELCTETRNSHCSEKINRNQVSKKEASSNYIDLVLDLASM